MRITVVIPTRERAITLRSALKTCIAQAYPDLEILVSDNYSQDDTRDVVHAAQDSRIRYVNPGRRISMTANWEFALSKVRDGFVTVLGDDDGLLPNAIEDLAALLKDTCASAVAWMKAEYCWPDHPVAAFQQRLMLPMSNQLVEMCAARVKRDICRLWLPYNRAPSLYNSLVSTKSIENARGYDNKLLRPYAPDIYSGIALLRAMDRYYYSTRSFSINGASSKSTGTTSYRREGDRQTLQTFLEEHDSEDSPVCRHVKGSVTSVVAEAIYQANRYNHGLLKPNDWLIFLKIVMELKAKDSQEFEAALPELKDLASKRGKTLFVRLCLAVLPQRPVAQKQIALGMNGKGVLTVDCSNFEVQNVYDAAQLAGRLLGRYRQPTKPITYTFWSRIVSTVVRGVWQIGVDKTL